MTQGIVVNAADHPIKSVTVFKSSRAEVVRTFTLDLKAGKNEIDITGLPHSMDADSARVTGLGEARLSDFTCVKPLIDTGEPPNALSQHIDKLRAQKDALEAEKRMREHQANFLAKYGDTLSAEHVHPEQALVFADTFLKQRMRDMETIGTVQQRISQLQTEMDEAYKRKRKRVGTGVQGEAHAVVTTSTEGPVQLKLTYIVTRTCWEPSYDLHAQTDADGQPTGSVTFKYRARVAQMTGEDWTDTTLILSTSTADALARGIPSARSLRVTPIRVAAEEQGDSDEDMGFGLFDGDELPLMTEATTKVGESAVSMTFTVEGKSTVPTDNIAHQLTIATLAFDATTSHVIVPRVEAASYILCSVKNTSDYRLLPGVVSVYLDDSFVSKTTIEHVDAGDAFDCTFGPDAALPVTYVQTETVIKGKGGAFAEKHNSTVYAVRVTLANKHRFPVKNVVVRESVPVASADFDGRATVILQRPAEMAEAKQGEEVALEGGVKARWAARDGAMEGRYEWVCDVDAGKEVVLGAQFEVRVPADIAWDLSG